MLQAYHKSEGKEVALKDEKLIMNSILAAMKWAKMDFAKEEWIKVIEATVPPKTIEINTKAFEAGWNLQ